jgi:DNA-binding NtrC family response regulator
MILPTASSGRILIVEPDEDTRNDVSHLLQGMGYSCAAVPNGPEAIVALQAHPYDLLITEIRIPEDEGINLIRTVANTTLGLLSIIITAYPSLDTAAAAIQLPVTAYLVKPVASHLLIDQVRKSMAFAKKLRRSAELEERARSCQERVDQTNIFLANTLQDTIQILESTRSAFKSKQLAALRRKLERILASQKHE